ncbi:MAG TPA: trypsin-like peptidase domain-containing protein, partial [Vicinamibacterales bacterium]
MIGRRSGYPVLVAALSSAVALLVGVILAGGFGASAHPSTGQRAEGVSPNRSSSTVLPGAVNFADVAERINPTVVNIDAATRGGSEPRRHGGVDDSDGQRDYDLPHLGSGSGFIIDRAGFILTNYHVIEDADRITVTLADGRVLKGDLVGTDPAIDVALLRVSSSTPLPQAPLGNSDNLRVGEWVCAIGNPLGYVHSVTVGVVSFLGRKLFDASLDDYIQTDAAINFGNSGGPLLNARGEVVGINAAISSRAANIGFAVPINQAVAILPQLKTRGRVLRGFIGVTLTDVTPDLQRSLGLTVSRGAIVQDIAADSPAQHAGLRPYDVIVS